MIEPNHSFRRVLRRCRAAAVTIAAGAVCGMAHAGGSGAGSPVPGELSASNLAPATGVQVTLRLRIEPDHDIVRAMVLFKSQGACGRVLPSDARRELTPLAQGRPASIEARVTVQSQLPCQFTAELLESNEPDAKIGSVYAITLNPAAAPESQTVTGESATGERTIDAVT